MNKVLLSVAVISLLGACGGGSDGGDSGGSETNLTGVWSQCESFTATSSESIHQYTGDQFIYSFATYLNDSCSGTPNASSETITGTFTIGEELTSTNGFESFELDLNVQSVFGLDLDESEYYDDYTIFSLTGDSLYYASLPNTNEEARPDEIDDTREYTQ